MLFFKTLLACAIAVVPVLAEISVTSPDADHYWVMGTKNRVTWNYQSGDPEQVTIIITNPDDNTLHGAFDIAEFVPVSQKSVEITEVTLKPGTGYHVVFVNATNNSQIYTTGPDFEVKAKGTTPAPEVSGSVAGGSSASATGSAASATTTAKKNGASAVFISQWTIVSTVVGAAAMGAASIMF